MPWRRTGLGLAQDGFAKFDLNQFDQSYFDALRARTLEAQNRGIYVMIMLFQGFSLDTRDDASTAWPYHPFNHANNVNGINGDIDGDGAGTEAHTLAHSGILALQRKYVEKVIDSVGDLDNVLFEIANEGPLSPENTAWQYDMISHIKAYEARKPKQHPVILTCQYQGANADTTLFNSSADGIAVCHSSYLNNPPAATGAKVIFADSDHLQAGRYDPEFIWEHFMRGNNSILLDLDNYPGPATDPLWVPVRQAIRDTRAYSEKMNLAAMPPKAGLSSTNYVLANTGAEYLIYQPAGGTFTANISAGTYAYEWFRPASGVIESGIISVDGGDNSFTPPFSGIAVMYLKNMSGP
jgi:hypothetical protein